MRPRRRFTIVDGMVLVAATAFGMAGYRAMTRYYGLHRLNLGLPPCLFAWTLAALALNLLKPKRNFRWLARKPGFSACAVSMVGLVFVVNQLLNDHIQLELFELPGVTLLVRMSFLMGPYNGLLVAGSWVVHFLCGHWKRKADWLEWLGRVLGMLWVVGATAGIWLSWL